MNTNLHGMPVGTQTVVTNADGSVTITQVTGRQVIDVRIPVVTIAGIAVLLVVLFWLAGRKNPQ